MEPDLNAPVEMAAWDLDMDGDDDLVTMSLYSESIQWFENLGNGTFADPKTLFRGEAESGPVFGSTNGGGPYELHITDMNNDGLLDLYVSGDVLQPPAFGSILFWLEHRPDHSFQPHILADSGLDFSMNGSLDVSLPYDLDNDGDPDILLFVYWENMLGYFENVNGDFQAFDTLIRDISIRNQMLFADLDTNGWSDLVVQQDDAIWTFERSSAMEFGPGRVLLDLTDAQNRRLRLADVTGSGRQQLIFGNTSAFEISVTRLNGDGLLEVTYNIPSGGIFSDDIYFTDVNGDGYQDILHSSFYGFSYLENFNDIGYQDFRKWDLLAWPHGSPNFNLDTLDLNADGFTDILLLHRNTNLLLGYIGNGAGGFDGPVRLSPGLMLTHDEDLYQTGDVNGDGRKDIVTAFTNELQAGVFSSRATASGEFDDPEPDFLFRNSDSTVIDRVRLCDVISGGPPELIVQRRKKIDLFTALDLLLFTYENDTVQFKDTIYRSMPIWFNNWDYDVSTADVDGDGDEDVAILGEGDDLGFEMRILYNDDLDFSRSMDISGVAALSQYDFADITGDQVIDLIAEDEQTDALYLYQGMPDGSFAARIPITPVPSGLDCEFQVEDLEGDGDLDIFRNCGSSLTAYVNDGSGMFTDWSYPFYGYEPEMSDLNGDGLPDLIYNVETINFEGTLVRYRINTGDPYFESEPVDAFNQGNSNFLKSMDVNGDEAPDLLSINRYSSRQLVWRENEIEQETVTSSTPSFVGPAATAYPNPSSGSFHVELGSGEPLNGVSAEAFNLAGQAVGGFTLKEDGYARDMAGLPPGIYYLKLNKNGTSLGTVIIEIIR